MKEMGYRIDVHLARNNPLFYRTFFDPADSS